MKKLITILFTGAAVLCIGTAKAQKSDTTKGWFRHDMHDFAGTAQIQVTYRNTNLDQLNTILNKNGIPSLKNNDIWINLSMNHVHKQWIVEDGIGFTPWTTSDDNNLKARFNQYQAYLRLGYNVIKEPDVRIFPFAGVNVSAEVLNIEDNNGIKSTSNFSDEILNSTSSKTFYQPNLGIELGGGLDYSIKVKEKQLDCITIQRSIPIGIRAGYYINAAQGDWRIENYKLQDGPDKKQNAFFVSVNIGLGYAVKK